MMSTSSCHTWFVVGHAWYVVVVEMSPSSCHTSYVVGHTWYIVVVEMLVCVML